jgi:uncharacterized membrane protein
MTQALSATVNRHRKVVEEWAWRLAPVVTALGSLLVNLAFLGRQSLRWEEAQATAAVTGTWSDLWTALRGHEAPQALYDLLLEPWLAFAGAGETAARAPAALFGAIAVGLICTLGTRLLGRPAGLVSAAVMATAVVVVEWSQSARGASLALAAAVAATLALVSALESPAWWRWLLWAVAGTLAVAASPLMVSALAAHAAAFLTYRPRPAWRLPASMLAAVTIVAAAASTFVLASDAVTIRGLGLPEADETWNGLWRLIGLSPIPVAVAGLGLFVLVTARVPGAERWKTVLLGTWLVAPVALGLLASLARPAFDAGYALAAVPALALLVAAGVVSQQRWVAVGLVALLGASAAFRLTEWYTGPSAQDWRGAVDRIRAEQRAGEAVIVLPERQRVAAAHYAGDGFVVDRPRGHRVWLLLGEEDELRRLQLARARVGPPRYALLEERRFGDRLWLQLWVEP